MQNVPPHIIQNVVNTVDFLAKNGIHNEEILRQRHQSNPEFSFLFPGDSLHNYYKSMLLNTSQAPSYNNRGSTGQYNQTHERRSRWNDGPNSNVNMNNMNLGQNAMHLANLNIQNYPFFVQQNVPGAVGIAPSNAQGMFSGMPMGMQQSHMPNSIPFLQYKNTDQKVAPSQPDTQQSIYNLSKTPEDIPCGMMADMIRQQIKKLKDSHQSNSSYVSLDPFLTPQTVKPSHGEKASEYMKSKLDSLYKFIDEERDLENRTKKSSSSSSSSKKNRDDSESESSRYGKSSSRRNNDYGQSRQDSYSEYGARADGQAYTSGDARSGLGTNTQDIYSTFRKQRSHQYHVSAEERSHTRDLPDVCFVCQKPGHIAKDCKFGLT